MLASLPLHTHPCPACLPLPSPTDVSPSLQRVSPVWRWGGASAPPAVALQRVCLFVCLRVVSSPRRPRPPRQLFLEWRGVLAALPLSRLRERRLPLPGPRLLRLRRLPRLRGLASGGASSPAPQAPLPRLLSPLWVALDSSEKRPPLNAPSPPASALLGVALIPLIALMPRITTTSPLRFILPLRSASPPPFGARPRVTPLSELSELS